jgi:hypothetical protein
MFCGGECVAPMIKILRRNHVIVGYSPSKTEICTIENRYNDVVFYTDSAIQDSVIVTRKEVIVEEIVEVPAEKALNCPDVYVE